MQQKVRRWLDDLPLNDPLERQQIVRYTQLLLRSWRLNTIGP
jgi:hypothetical protein